MSLSTPILTTPPVYWACAAVLINAATTNDTLAANLIAVLLLLASCCKQYCCRRRKRPTRVAATDRDRPARCWLARVSGHSTAVLPKGPDEFPSPHGIYLPGREPPF